MHGHETRNFYHEWFCLYVEVPEHLVAASAANQLNNVAVTS